MRQYFNKKRRYYLKKNLFDELLLCLLAKPIPNCRAYVDIVIFLSFIIPVSKQ